MPLTLRALGAGDRSRVRDIVVATGSFRDDEVDVALEVFDATYASATPDDYEFVGVDNHGGSLVGYACFGPTPCTDRTYDLYWIAVHPDAQGAGAGSRLLADVEHRLVARNARMLVIETSSRQDYTATRGFYLARGYDEVAQVRDFYAPGDHRVIYSKRLPDHQRSSTV
jgi:ribosomal protein S18 acetylase RimI-like enzyme